MKKRGRKSQVTIFIIIAILIVGTIILFFLLAQKKPQKIFKPSVPNLQESIEKCVRDATQEAISIMLPQGGYINPTNYKLYKNNKVAYLCYNTNYYQTCVNQQPLYIQFLEQQIRSYIEPKIKDCFYSLKQEYKKKNYAVNDGDLSLNVKLNPKQVEINVFKKFEVNKGEETRKFEKFRVRIPSPLYDLGIASQEIASQEAKYCSSLYLGYSLTNPEISIDKKQVGSGQGASKIYIIKDKVTNKSLMIAIRSCAMPGGL